MVSGKSAHLKSTLLEAGRSVLATMLRWLPEFRQEQVQQTYRFGSFEDIFPEHEHECPEDELKYAHSRRAWTDLHTDSANSDCAWPY